MASEFHRNAERYYDPTAGAALVNVEKGERMDWKVGDVVTATRQGSTVENRFIILANDGYTFTGCVLLPKELPNCVPVMCGTRMYANPYKINYISFSSNDITLVRVATYEELTAVQNSVRVAFGFECDQADKDEDSDLADLAEAQAKELIEANARADIYKELYENLLTRCLKTA